MPLFRLIPVQKTPADTARDLPIFDEDLPCQVIITSLDVREVGTSFTEVKHETTDDN